MNLPNESIESLCDYADGLRADGVSWEGVMERLREADHRGDLRELTMEQLQRWHGASQKRKFAAQKARERREMGLDDADEGGYLLGVGNSAVDVGYFEGGEKGEISNIEQGISNDEGAGAVRSFSDEARELVKYLAGDLVGKVGRWQFARHRVLRAGEVFERHKGPGELGGVRWRMGAVSIWRELGGEREVVEVLPEHRVKQVYARRPPVHYHETLKLMVFSFENMAAVKVCQELLAVEAALRAPGLFPGRRRQLERTRRRLEAKASAAGERHGVTVLKVQEIVSRLATTMHLYVPETTGVKSGAELARALNRTRAAVSAAKLKKVEEDTRATGGQAGFEGMRAAGRHREKVREIF